MTAKGTPCAKVPGKRQRKLAEKLGVWARCPVYEKVMVEESKAIGSSA